MKKPSGTLVYGDLGDNVIALTTGDPATIINCLTTPDLFGNTFASGLIPDDSVIEVVGVFLDDINPAPAFVCLPVVAATAGYLTTIHASLKFSATGSPPVVNFAPVRAYVRVWNNANMAI